MALDGGELLRPDFDTPTHAVEHSGAHYLDQMLKKTARAAIYFEWSRLLAFAARTPSAEKVLFHL